MNDMTLLNIILLTFSVYCILALLLGIFLYTNIEHLLSKSI